MRNSRVLNRMERHHRWAMRTPRAENSVKEGYARTGDGGRAMHVTTARAILFVLALLYVAFFNYVYITIVSERWAYAGLVYNPTAMGTVLMATVFALVPIAWMPIRLTRPSQVLYWLLYAVVYLPSMFVPHYLQRQTTAMLYLLCASLCASLWIAGKTYSFRLPRVPDVQRSSTAWWVVLFSGLTVSYVAVLAVYGNRLEFSGLYNLDLRLETRPSSRPLVTDYAQLWTANTMNPLLMALGLLMRRRWLFLIGAAGQVLLFMTSADKIFLLSVGFLPLVYLSVKSRLDLFGLKFLGTMTLLLLATVCLGFVDSTNARVLQDLISFRFISNAGYTTAVYADFFSQSAWTYWSHLRGLSTLLLYPYDTSLGFVIGDFLGSPDNHANAHVWATDGIAAMGLVGVLVAGGLISVVFFLLDSAAAKSNVRLSALSVAIHGVAIGNVSIATTCLGGGLFFHMFLLWFMPPHLRQALNDAGAAKVTRQRGIQPHKIAPVPR